MMKIRARGAKVWDALMNVETWLREKGYVNYRIPRFDQSETANFWDEYEFTFYVYTN